jgi:hypothetical protein
MWNVRDFCPILTEVVMCEQMLQYRCGPGVDSASNINECQGYLMGGGGGGHGGMLL